MEVKEEDATWKHMVDDEERDGYARAKGRSDNA